MDRALNIAYLSSEVFPFAKTGGLADVAGSLPLELADLGHAPMVFMPAYKDLAENHQLESLELEFEITIGNRQRVCRVFKTELATRNGNQVPVFFVDHPDYFHRAGLYGEQAQNYADNCERFTFFCRAVLELIKELELPVDLFHANDWQTGLLPALLKTEYQHTSHFENVPCVFTIHNLAYQGLFPHSDMVMTGIDPARFNWREMEFYGQLNMLKTGLVFCDQITTVSPTYALEIQSAELGCGLDDVLRVNQDRLTGIMNGIDQDSWNPATDPQIVANFDSSNWQSRKAVNKEHLQRSCGLKVDPKIPLIGSVGRLASQKGWSILLPILEYWLESIDVQWSILGTGDPLYEKRLDELANQYPEKLNVHLGFSETMARQIEAACDIFVMPSEYEPCGLNQLYSLRYGSVPVVRKTGGLADSIVDAQANEPAEPPNGFVFDQFSVGELETALARAISCYLNSPQTWATLVKNGMQRDASWKSSANRYVDLYRQMIFANNHSDHESFT